MSASAESLDLREQIVRIDRAIAETRKFQAESDKLRRDRSMLPVTAIATIMGAGGALVAATVALMKALG